MLERAIQHPRLGSRLWVARKAAGAPGRAGNVGAMGDQEAQAVCLPRLGGVGALDAETSDERGASGGGDTAALHRQGRARVSVTRSHHVLMSAMREQGAAVDDKDDPSKGS